MLPFALDITVKRLGVVFSYAVIAIEVVNDDATRTPLTSDISTSI